jgi:hypothetical protein
MHDLYCDFTVVCLLELLQNLKHRIMIIIMICSGLEPINKRDDDDENEAN